MNRGHVLQSSPVHHQLMAAGSPNWWNINNMRPPPSLHHHNQQESASFLAAPPSFFPQYAPPPLSSSSSSSTTSSSQLAVLSPSWNDHNLHEVHHSWSQLLLGPMLAEDQEKGAHEGVLGNMQANNKRLENWEEQILHHHQGSNSVVNDVKQENSAYVYGHGNVEFQAKQPTWSPHQMIPASSPKSCVTTLSSNMLDFSSKKTEGKHPPPDHSSECNSTATGGAPKKARVQPPSTQSTFKVRKEKLGDRITALHQLVSPFGKTDTASVLLEAIGYIRFLQSQIEALSLPYLGSGSGNMRQQQQHSHVQGERNCLFPEDPGQLVNDNCMKRKGTCEQDCDEELNKDLRSRGLCLVPISCTLQVGSDNGADYWAPALGGGFR